MSHRRLDKVEHVVRAERSIRPGPDGRPGDTLELRFEPDVGQIRVFVRREFIPGPVPEDSEPDPPEDDEVLVPTLDDRPPLAIRRGEGPVFTDPDIPPLDPEHFKVRVEVGPASERLVLDPQESTKFSDVNFIFHRDGTEPELDPRVDHSARGVAVDGATESDPGAGPWVCRVTNMGGKHIKCRVAIFFTRFRVVTASTLPMDQLTERFQGALRWMTPQIEALDGGLRVGLPPDAAHALDIEKALTIKKDGLDLDLKLAIAPVTFTARSGRDVLRTWMELVRRRVNDELRVGSGPDVLPADFVDAVVGDVSLFVSRSLRASAVKAARRMSPSVIGGRVENEVKDAFSDLGISEEIKRRGAPLREHDLDNDLGLSVSLAVTDISVSASAAQGAAEFSVEALTAELDLYFSRGSGLIAHPRSNDDLHRNETLPRGVLLLTDRFRIDVKDFDVDDVDIELGLGLLGDVVEVGIEAAVETILDALEGVIQDLAEGEVRDGVKDFINEERTRLEVAVEEVAVELADRERSFHDLRVEGNQLVIETFDPAARAEGLRPRLRLPGGVLEPIDGPMPDDAGERLRQIEHIVVVMMENRSFDHMLGFASHPDHRPRGISADIDGLTPATRIPLGEDVEGDIGPLHVPDLVFIPDPSHGFDSTAKQVNNGRMDGFVSEFARKLAGSQEIVKGGRFADEKRVAGFYGPDEVPFFRYTLENFAVLDRWFSSHPGPTYPNRMCMLSGETRSLSGGGIKPDMGYLTEPTLFEALDAEGVDWRCYEGDIAFLRLYDKYRLDFDRIRPLQEFLGRGDAPLPEVTFIEPNFSGVPSELPPTDDHPPTSIAGGQWFLTEVMRRVMESSSWDKTMVIVTYDEHGGFFDHVPPPGTTMFHLQNPHVDTDIPRIHPDASHYGVRVPALVASPLIPRFTVGHQIYDHTTIPRTILELFAPGHIKEMPERVRRSRHLGELLGRELRSVPMPAPLPMPGTSAVAVTKGADLRLDKAEDDEEDARILFAKLGIPTGWR